MHRVLLNDIPDDVADQRFEKDEGLMPGDDGGYTDYAQLCLEEDALRNIPTGVYALLGDSSVPHPDVTDMTPQQQRLQKATIGILSSSQLAQPEPSNDSKPTLPKEQNNSKLDPQVAPSGTTKGSTAPTHPLLSTTPSKSTLTTTAVFNRTSEQSHNLMQLLGTSSIVVRSVEALRKVRQLREQAFKAFTDNLNLPSDSKLQEKTLHPVVKEEPGLVPGETNNSTSEKGGPNSKLDAPSTPKKSASGSPYRSSKVKIKDKKLGDSTDAFKDKDKDNKGIDERRKGKTKDKDREKGSKSGIGSGNKDDVDIFEITNELLPLDSSNSTSNSNNSSNNKRPTDHPETRERAMGRSVCALMAAHSGFTHASTHALNILTDVLEFFVWNIGRDLQGCNNNFDVTSTSSSDVPPDELMRVIGSCGFRGGFADLECYARSDLVQTEVCLRNAYERLRIQLSSTQPLINGKSLGYLMSESASKSVSESLAKAKSKSEPQLESVTQQQQEKEGGSDTPWTDVKLDHEAFSFGFLNPTVRLDVLNGIKVTSKLAYNKIGDRHKDKDNPSKSNANNWRQQQQQQRDKTSSG